MAAPYTTYLEHLQRGELAYQYSPSARQPVFFPRVLSPFDANETLEWRVASGFGTVYSTTAISSRDGGEYNVALIDCDEGFRMMSRVEDIAARDVTIGMRVKFRVHPASSDDDDPYPVFVPVKEVA